MSNDEPTILRYMHRFYAIYFVTLLQVLRG